MGSEALAENIFFFNLLFWDGRLAELLASATSIGQANTVSLQNFGVVFFSSVILVVNGFTEIKDT